MSEESILVASAEEDDAAFEAGFEAGMRGAETEYAPATEAPTEAPAEVEVVAEEPTEPPSEAPAEAGDPPKLFAGLTEEQLAAALARTSQLQSTVDKLAGRMGTALQKIDSLMQAPKNASEQRAFDLKLERLNAAFPELAEILREDLKPMGMPEQVEVPVQQGFTQEQVEQMLQDRLQTFQHQQNEAMEIRALGAVHPDWEQVIRTPQFALWRDNVISDGAELMSSESAAFISAKLSEFKQWQNRPTQPAQALVTPAPSRRLANAVQPASRAAPAAGPVSEDDAFEAGFKKVRGQGY